MNTTHHIPTTLLALALVSGSHMAFASPMAPAHNHAATTPAAPTLDVADGRPARAYPNIRWDRPTPAAKHTWAQFLSDTDGVWHSLWDSDTGVPSRIYGSGVPVPNSVAKPWVAERHALDMLGKHINMLAPGARVQDFQLVSNHLGDGIRSVGFAQFYHGMRVLGGQVSFRFKNDRMFVIGSEALPRVRAPVAQLTLDGDRLRQTAAVWIAEDAEDAWIDAGSSEPEGPFVLPVITRGGVRYHTVMRVTVEARSPIGRWHVYLDVNTGDAVARRQMLMFSQGTVQYNVPVRYPGAIRAAMEAPHTSLTVAGVPTVSDENGVVSWESDSSTTVLTSVTGTYVTIENRAGEQARGSVSLSPDGTTEWDLRDVERDDAQLTTFIHSHVVKEYARTIAPDLEYLDTQLRARVNIDDSCNAYSDGVTINFYRSSDRCENTGRLADVVYHEFGHAFHIQSIIDGVGAFDGAFSEGAADFLSALITGDPGMGRGFFYGFGPLRHIDPAESEAHWPEDISEIHTTGLIFAGAMWDLRKQILSTYGTNEGTEKIKQLYRATLQRATNIPTSYVEVLVADDDDGDLSNGTPNECAINYTFGTLHGLRTFTSDYQPLGRQTPEQDGYGIHLDISNAGQRCPGDAIDSAVIEWELRPDTVTPGATTPLTNSIEMTLNNSVFSGTIPAQEDGAVVRYRIAVTLADGSVGSFPSNLSDTAYEFYVGDIVELYCHDFETNPFEEDWTRDVVEGDESQPAWEWGTPAGRGLDPAQAYAGTGIIGTEIGLTEQDDGVYLNNRLIEAHMPMLDVGAYSDVRLQYRRWLTVEDGFYDHADILSNAEIAWSNRSNTDDGRHHVDTAWVFHDVPLSGQITDGTVQVSFLLESDQGLEFGGWNMDEMCIVANPRAFCGDGVRVGFEACDDGDDNSNTKANACRTNCQLAFCGDGVVDALEECEDLNDNDDDDCNNNCLRPAGYDSGWGCRADGIGSGQWPVAVFVVLFAGYLLRRRRHPGQSRMR